MLFCDFTFYEVDASFDLRERESFDFSGGFKTSSSLLKSEQNFECYFTKLLTMARASGRAKGKVRWSKLYSFSCLRPNTTEPSPIQQLGGPGFSRVVFCNESHIHKNKPYRYPNNYISTTKYNFVTFLPKALFEQFRRVANFYFLLAAILSVTSLAPFSPASVIAPLVFVVGVSMLKEAMEDWHRLLQVPNAPTFLLTYPLKS